MKIRNKISIVVIAAWVILIFTLYLGSQLIIKKSYVELEDEMAIRNLERAVQAVKDMENSLVNTLSDWAVWDDSYYFMENKNSKFIESNLKASSFGQSNIDIILYFTPTGDQYYGVAADETRTKEVSMPAGLSEYIKPNSVLTNQPYVYSETQGIISLPSGILVVAAHAIMRSSNMGPVKGSLVMARSITGSARLNEATNNQIEKITKVETHLYALNKIPQEKDLLIALENLKKNSFFITKPNNNELFAYILLHDINKQPIAIVKEKIPRHIYQIGLGTITYYNVLGVVSSVLLLFVLWLSIHSLVVRRIETLKDELHGAKQGSKFTSMDSNKVLSDEITAVALLYHHATHDPLTGLGNRHMINQTFMNSYANLKQDHKIALLFIDIDNFKNVNDTFGHDVGDKILNHASALITSCIRGTDIAARLGGDEFVVLLINVRQHEVEMVIERMYARFRKETVIDSYHLDVRYSMGVSFYPEDGNDIYTLIKNADIALYHAKSMGKNQFQYFTEKLTIDIQDASKKELELQRAIDNNELCLFYQPIYDTYTNQLVNVEALIRWKHPVKGLLSANDIIPIAEKSGLIIPIGKWVLRTACMQIRQWINEGLPPIPVAVNISSLQIKNMSINKLITDVVKETGIDPKLLEIELTETAYIEISKEIIEELKMLRNLGVQLTIDDFGAGYSGVGYLKSLPVCKLKIDYSFIRDILTDADDRAIILAIITVAHQLNLRVVAEGVETLYQYEFLKKNDVDYIQGNYFSPPVDVEVCRKIIEAFSLISK